MTKLIVKQIDKYTSSTFDGKIMYEYLIYVMVGDVNVRTLTTLDENYKTKFIESYINERFPDSILEEITYEQHINKNV